MGAGYCDLGALRWVILPHWVWAYEVFVMALLAALWFNLWMMYGVVQLVPLQKKNRM